jgi:hypothetical protein
MRRHNSHGNNNHNGQKPHPKAEALARGIANGLGGLADGAREIAHNARERKEQAQQEHDDLIRREEHVKAEEQRQRERRRQEDSQRIARSVNNVLDSFAESARIAERQEQDRQAFQRSQQLAREQAQLRAEQQELARQKVQLAELERQRVEGLTRQYMDAAHNYVATQDLGNALTQFDYALQVANTGQALGITSYLPSLTTPQYDMRNPLVAKIYAERVACAKEYTWQKMKPGLTTEYERLTKLELHSDNADFNQVLEDINALLSTIKTHIVRPTADDESIERELIARRNLVQKKAARQTEQKKWQARRAAVNAAYLNIFNMNKVYGELALDAHSKTLTDCATSYATFADFLSYDEQANQLNIPDLQTEVLRQLHERNERNQRLADRTKALAAEMEIDRLLAEIQRHLQDHELQKSLTKLSLARQQSANIKYVADITKKLYAQASYFDQPIKHLQQEILDSKQRFDRQPSEFARRIVEAVAEECKDRAAEGLALRLMRRHYDRLIASLTEDFKKNWLKFDNKPELELTPFFDELIRFIAVDVVPTYSGQRLAPWNWSTAGLALHHARSKLVAPAMSNKFRNYVAPSASYTVQLAIFGPGNYQAQDNVPFAVVVPPLRRTESVEEKFKPSAPPIWQKAQRL